jgi:cytochrome c biogenesis protein CcdA
MAGGIRGSQAQPEPVVRLVYFYRDDCPHCIVVIDEILEPLQKERGEALQIKMVQLRDPEEPGGIDAAKYDMLIRAEEMLGVAAEERGFPTLVMGTEVLIGEDQIRQQLECMIDSCIASGGTAWPEIPGLETIRIEGGGGDGGGFDPAGGSAELCELDETDVCASPEPVWAAYFYQVGCRECSRAESDLQYVRSLYPQLVIDELNIYEHTDLAQYLATRAGRGGDIGAPAVFIGDDALISADEITPQSLAALVEKYASAGAPRTWEVNGAGIVPRPSLPNVLTVLVAGLIDGLNPCAFATLIFLISYLSAVGRRGRALLLVGGLFTLGVFVAYTLVGVGLWRALSAVPAIAQSRVGPWLYGATAVVCLALAIGSLLDFLKARRGDVSQMTLVMPERLRRRVNAVIRRSSTARAFAFAALPAGVVVSLLELACTGQVYLPTIIYVMSVPEMQARATLLLLLYNLMFVLPLAIVFCLVYFGATSHQLGRVLRRHAASVKLGTAILFVGLAGWLVASIVL